MEVGGGEGRLWVGCVPPCSEPRESSKTARWPPRPRVAQNTSEDDRKLIGVCHLGCLSFIFLAGIRDACPPQRRHSLLRDSNLSDAQQGALLQPRQATPPKSRLPITEKQAVFCRSLMCVHIVFCFIPEP